MSTFSFAVASAQRFRQVDLAIKQHEAAHKAASAVTAALVTFKTANGKLRDAVDALRTDAAVPDEAELRAWVAIEIARTLGAVDFGPWLEAPTIEALTTSVPPLAAKLQHLTGELRDKLSELHKSEERAERDALAAFEAMPTDQREAPFLTDEYVSRFTNQKEI